MNKKKFIYYNYISIIIILNIILFQHSCLAGKNINFSLKIIVENPNWSYEIRSSINKYEWSMSKERLYYSKYHTIDNTMMHGKFYTYYIDGNPFYGFQEQKDSYVLNAQKKNINKKKGKAISVYVIAASFVNTRDLGSLEFVSEFSSNDNSTHFIDFDNISNYHFKDNPDIKIIKIVKDFVSGEPSLFLTIDYLKDTDELDTMNNKISYFSTKENVEKNQSVQESNKKLSINIGILVPFYKDTFNNIKNKELIKNIEKTEKICRELIYKKIHKNVSIDNLEYPEIIEKPYSNHRLEAPIPTINSLIKTAPVTILKEIKNANPQIKAILIGNVEEDFDNKILFCLRLYISNLDDAIVIKEYISIKSSSLEKQDIEDKIKNLLEKMIFQIIKQIPRSLSE